MQIRSMIIKELFYSLMNSYVLRRVHIPSQFNPVPLLICCDVILEMIV
jgi:hypothetical protein